MAPLMPTIPFLSDELVATNASSWPVWSLLLCPRKSLDRVQFPVRTEFWHTLEVWSGPLDGRPD